jgi:hypothetical protein
MITTFLVPALALTFGGDHAAYHPKDTNFYFEVPSLSGTLEAYKEAPLVRLFEDPELQGFLGMVLDEDPEDVTLPNLYRMLLDEVRDELPVAGVDFLDLASQVNDASVSLSGIDLNGLLPLIQQAEVGELEDLMESLGEMQVTVVVDFTASEGAEDAEILIRSQLLDHALLTEPNAPNFIDASRPAGTAVDLSDYNLGPNDHPLFVTVLRSDERLSVSLGSSAKSFPHQDESSSLATNERYQRSGDHWMGSNGKTILNTYFSLTGFGELVELLDLIPDCPPQLVDGANFFLDMAMPGGGFHVRTRTHIEGGRFHSESFSLEPSRDPDTQLLRSEPISRESFRMASPDAVSVSAFNLNKHFLAETLMQGLVTLTGDEEQELLADLKENYNTHPVHDLVGSLGGSAVTYTLPYTSVGQPQVFMAIDLEDSVAFTRGLEALGDYALDHGDGMIAVHSRAYRKHPVVAFSPGKALMEELFKSMGDAAPAFIQMTMVVAVRNDRAIISSSSVYAKRELKRLMKADDSDRHALMDEATDLPAGINSYTTTDWGAMIAGGYDSVRGFLPLIVAGANIDLPFELEDMPSGDLIPKYFEPSVLWSRQMEEGTYTHGVSSFGPELPFCAGIGIGAGVVIGIRKERESNSWPKAVEAQPNPNSTLMAALELYRAEHKVYPAKLEDLTVPSTNFPNGFLGGQPLPANMTYTPNDSGDGYELIRTETHEHGEQAEATEEVEVGATGDGK